MSTTNRNEPVIVETARTPIGRANKGQLADVRADELMAFILRALVDKVPELDPTEVTDVICGNVANSGETGFSIARTASILAGLPVSVPGLSINRFCASSLQAIRIAGHAIQAGEGEAYIAGGVEKLSIPVLADGTKPERRPNVGPGGANPRLLGKDDLPFVYIPMGLTAEKVARKFGVSREDQDAFAKLSQDKAAAAIEAGFYKNEITPYVKNDGTVIESDESPRPGTTLEALGDLKPAFRADGGSVTAGNSCPLNDGAAATLVMSRGRAEDLGLRPRARIVASSISGNAPEIMGVAPIDAIPRALAAAGLTIKDVDVVELNEAFAAQVLPVCEATGIDIERQLNPHGGAIALGHPFGMTGSRIMSTLLNDLETLDGTFGMETMCAAGGMAMAMVVERLH